MYPTNIIYLNQPSMNGFTILQPGQNGFAGIPNSVFITNMPNYSGITPNQDIMGLLQQADMMLQALNSQMNSMPQQNSNPFYAQNVPIQPIPQYNPGNSIYGQMPEIQPIPPYNPNNPVNITPPVWNDNGGGLSSIVEFAKGHTGMYNDGRFSQGRNEKWCADFVNYAYEQKLGTVPWGYRGKNGNYKAAVSELRDWGQSQGVYSTIEESRTNGFRDIKQGDLIIFKRNGRSHTGLVESIDENGNIHTVEGNASNKVKQKVYKPDNKYIDGFVRANDYLARQQKDTISAQTINI